MKYIVVAVFDAAAGAYARPAFVGSKGIAVRSFQDEVRREAPDNQMHSHPMDFVLYFLGFYDDILGSFECGVPVILLRGSDCLTGGSHVS